MMSLVRAPAAKICVPSLNDDVSSGDGQRILRLRAGLMKVGRVQMAKGRRVGHFIVTEQQIVRRRKEMMEEEETRHAMTTIEDELSQIVGLDALKIQLKTWLRGMLLDDRRRAMGIDIGPRRLPQFAFLGNPGTGKTMVARKLARLLHMVGMLPNNRVIEVQRTDLVGQYVGQTGPQTRSKIIEADGGILFVDEAYRLVASTFPYKDFGKEALEEIMSFMDKERIVVIFAGYTEPMKLVLSSNEGMRRRVSNIFHFDDFTCQQLAEILHLKLPNKDAKSPLYGFKLDSRSTSVEDIAELIKRETSEEQRKSMNGGLIDQMLIKARENLDSRIDVDCNDKYSIVAITYEDLEMGLRLLRPQEKEGTTIQY